MGFARAVIEYSKSRQTSGLRASLRKRLTAKATLLLIFAGSLPDELEWRAGDGIEVLIGNAGDHGLLRLRKNTSAAQARLNIAKCGRPGSVFLTLSLGHQSAFVDRAEPAAECKWEKAEDGWIEAVLPKWADETGPKRSVVALPSGQSDSTKRPVGRPPLHRAKDVTSALMGDPAPSRSALAQKQGG